MKLLLAIKAISQRNDATSINNKRNMVHRAKRNSSKKLREYLMKEEVMSWEAWGDSPEIYCEMCGNVSEDCVCEQCPVCNEVGNPECYKLHGLVETEEQIQERIKNNHDDSTW